jgi:hypothetical protein
MLALLTPQKTNSGRTQTKRSKHVRFGYVAETRHLYRQDGRGIGQGLSTRLFERAPAFFTAVKEDRQRFSVTLPL